MDAVNAVGPSNNKQNLSQEPPKNQGFKNLSVNLHQQMSRPKLELPDNEIQDDMESDQRENLSEIQAQKQQKKQEEAANAYEYDENGRPTEKPAAKDEKPREVTKGAAAVKDIEKEISRLN